LEWLRRWSRGQLTGFKRKLKYSPRKTAFNTEELELLKALNELESAAGRLLAESAASDPPPPPGGYPGSTY
jgi:hypothetical protein